MENVERFFKVLYFAKQNIVIDRENILRTVVFVPLRRLNDNESTENNGHEGKFSDINIDLLLLFLILHAVSIFFQYHVIDFRSSIDPGWIIQYAVTGSDCC